jgi:hypothetical protein
MRDFDKPTQIGDFTVFGLQSIDEEDCLCEEKHGPATLLGHFYIGGGAMVHAFFLRVKDHPDDGQVAFCDPYNRFADVCQMDEIAFAEIEIPGYEGAWIFYAHGGAR